MTAAPHNIDHDPTMETKTSPAVDEIKRLQGCINDLVSVQALASVWSGQEPYQIVDSLLEVLVFVLRLDFAYARVGESMDDSSIELVRLPDYPSAYPREIIQAIASWLTGGRIASPGSMPNPLGDGEVYLAHLGLGLRHEIGIVVGGSRRANFPTEAETLLLRVAANQAVIVLQEARRLREEKRAASELERQVAERTAQLYETQQRLRAILENSPAMVFLKDIHGRYLDCNPPFEKLCGLSRDRIIGKTDWELFPAEQAAQFAYNDIEVLKAGRPIDFEETAHHRDGLHTSIVSKFPLCDAKDHIYAIGGIVTDITERKRAEMVLRESQERLRLMIDGVKDYAIFMLDPEGRVTSWNAGAERIKGYREEEILGQHFSRFYPAEEIAKGKPEEQLKLATAAGRIEHEGWRVRKDGTRFWGEVLITALRDQAGKLIGFSKVTRDVTERRRAEEALAEVQVELARVSRVMTMGELTASIAHEVNQPLAAVIANADLGLSWLARKTPNLDEARAVLGRITRDANRAREVVARIRSLLTKTAMEKQQVGLTEAIAEVIALAQVELLRNRVTLLTEFAGDLPLVLGDRVQLQQVVLNLLMNGIEAMSELGDRPREMMITTSRNQDNTVCVSVRDSGRGLKCENLERVFDAFYTTKHEGMGMGLSISRSIITMHSGRLWAARNDGGGATFHFTLPVYQP